MNAMGLPELAPDEAGPAASGGPSGPSGKRSKNYVPVAVSIPRALSREAFERRALQQVLGGNDVEVVWSGVAERYLPSGSPAIVMFEERLLLRARGQVNQDRGIDSDEQGHVVGAAERAGAFVAQPGSEEKSAVLAEVDRRYRAAIGPLEETGDLQKTALWRQLRDEVLFQAQHLAALPAEIQRVIRLSLQGRDLAPRDYDPLFRIAQKLALLPPGDLRGLEATLGDVSTFSALELCVDGFFAKREERDRGDAERTAVQNKLLGLEDLYRLYVRASDEKARDAASPLAGPLTTMSQSLGFEGATYEELRPQLERELARHGFASIAEFGAHIAAMERTFEEGAARITLDVLDRYAATLHREAERYRDPGVVRGLHEKLGGFRDSYKTYEANAAQVQGRNERRGTIESTVPNRVAGPTEQANAAREAAVASIEQLAAEYPIFAEGELPEAQRLDKVRLARAGADELGPLLQHHMAERLRTLAAARGQLERSPVLVYKLDKLVPLFYAELDIQPGSIHDLILQDKQRTDAITKMLGGLLLAVVTVALTVVSAGAATPPLVAAGASAAAAGISVHVAAEELQTFSTESTLAAAGLAEDPSVAWLAISILGAGVDLAVAANAVRALSPAAHALDATGDAAAFGRTLQDLRAARQLDERIAVAAERAAAARAAYGAAKHNLTSALAKAYSFPGPLTDPAVYSALVQMGVAKLREGVHSLSLFVDELKQARLAAKLGDLSPEELAAAKGAWSRAQALAPLVSDAAHLEVLFARIPDPAVLERLLRVFPSAELVKIATVLDDPSKIVVMLEHLGEANTGKLIRQWIIGGDATKANNFLARMDGQIGNALEKLKELDEHSFVADTNTIVSVAKAGDDKLRPSMNPRETANAALVEGLPADRDIRIANITAGETDNALGFKGFPLSRARDSREYAEVLQVLENQRVGGPGGFADQALVADVFFAKAKPGSMPRLITGDGRIVKPLARLAGMDPNLEGGLKGLAKKFGVAGFPVTINGRTILVIPVQ